MFQPVVSFLHILILLILVMIMMDHLPHKALIIFILSACGFIIDIAYISYQIMYVSCFSIMSIIRLYFWMIMGASFLFEWMQSQNPRHFHNIRDKDIDFFYFTIVTISTTGYGDITPMTALAKRMVSLFILCGMVLNIIFINQIILHISFRCSNKKIK